MPKIVVISSEMIIILWVPECPSAAKNLIRFTCRKCLNRSHNRGQIVSLKRLEHAMYMVRHDAPRKQLETAMIKMLQCLLHQGGDFGTPEPALTNTCVEVSLYLLGMKPIEFLQFNCAQAAILLTSALNDCVSIGKPRLNNVLWQRID